MKWEEQPEFKKTEIIAKSRRCIDEADASEALISISDEDDYFVMCLLPIEKMENNMAFAI